MTTQKANVEKRTAIPFCCPNCGSQNISSFESPEGEFDHGLYHVWLNEECGDCQTTFTTILHPVWIENIDVPITAAEKAERSKRHIAGGLYPSDYEFSSNRSEGS
jgi:hypothetical protein